MAENLLELSSDELKAGITPALREFLSHEGDYPSISESARSLIGRGSYQAVYVPAVKFLVDATLDILNQPQVAARLPQEVMLRQAIASHEAGHIARIVATPGLFTQFYATDEYLRHVRLKVEDVDTVNKPDYLASLGAAPFFDTRVVAGGALKFIRETGIDEEPSKVIGRSLGLLAVAGIHKEQTDRAMNVLGLPYADSFNFVGKSGGQEIKFSRIAFENLKRSYEPGRGCPAGRIALAGASNSNLLQQYWSRIVDYLIPADATTNGLPKAGMEV
jgi:hypothetical protein